MKKVTLLLVGLIMAFVQLNAQIVYCDNTEESGNGFGLPLTFTGESNPGLDMDIMLYTNIDQNVSTISWGSAFEHGTSGPAMTCRGGVSTGGNLTAYADYAELGFPQFQEVCKLDLGVVIPTGLPTGHTFQNGNQTEGVFSDSYSGTTGVMFLTSLIDMQWNMGSGVVEKFIPIMVCEGACYGWICVSITATNGELESYTVHDWAFNSTPGEPINAGEGRPVEDGVMSSFNVYDTDGIITGDAGATDGSIAVSLPYGDYDLGAYAPTFTTSPADAVVTVESVTQESEVTEQDFEGGNVVTYVVTSGSIVTTYTATVSITPGNSECELTMFALSEGTAPSTPNHTAFTITDEVAANVDKSALHLQWVGSVGMVVTTEVEGIIIPDPTGTGVGTAVNCCNPIEITFTSEDGETVKVYTLTVNGGMTCSPVESVTLQAGSIDVDGGTYDMSADLEVLPAEAAQTVTWTIEGDAYGAIILDGVVTASGEDEGDGTITVRATATDGSEVYGEADVEITNQVTVGIENHNSIVSIYPNPTTGIVNIEGATNSEIVVTDITGKIIFSGTNLTTIDLSNQSEGIYLIKISSEDKVETHKIILQ